MPTIIADRHMPAPSDWRRYPISMIAFGAAVLVFGLVFLFAFFGAFFTVAQYERDVVTRAGRLLYIAEPGFHFKVPFLDEIHPYRVDIQQFTTPRLNTYTVDNQEVDATLTVQWQIPVDQVGYVFTNTPAPSQNLAAMVVDRFKVEAGQINVTQFANNRGALVKKVYDIVREEANRLYHIRVTDVQLPNLDYQESFRQAQAQAAVVKTQIEQSMGLKQKAEIDAATKKLVAEGDAAAAVEAARGRAQATQLQADAEAHATEVKGAALAKAQELMAGALAKSSELVEYEKATRWNGQLPQNIYAGAPIPFLQPTDRPRSDDVTRGDDAGR